MADHDDERADDAEPRPAGTMNRRSETVIDNPADSSPEDEVVAQLLEHSLDLTILASAVQAQQPADAADTLETLDESEAAQVRVDIDGEEVATGVGANVLGNPLRSIEFLVNHLSHNAQAGSARGLKKGHLVITGTMHGKTDVRPGTNAAAHFGEALGSIEVSFV